MGGLPRKEIYESKRQKRYSDRGGGGRKYCTRNKKKNRQDWKARSKSKKVTSQQRASFDTEKKVSRRGEEVGRKNPAGNP